MLKPLSIVIIILALAACASEETDVRVPPTPTATAEVPELTQGEVIALVREFLVPKRAGTLDKSCDDVFGRFLGEPKYRGQRVWEVPSGTGQLEWRVYEKTLIVESLNSVC